MKKQKYRTKCSAIYSITIKTLFVASFPIILDVYCLDYYQLKEIVQRKRKKKNEKFFTRRCGWKSFHFFLFGDVQTRIANIYRSTTKWIEGAQKLLLASFNLFFLSLFFNFKIKSLFIVFHFFYSFLSAFLYFSLVFVLQLCLSGFQYLARLLNRF